VPDLYDDVQKVPSDEFRVIDTWSGLGPGIDGGEQEETKAVQPLVSPVAGTQTGEVTMQSPNAGAQIRYTTDGTEPSSASTLYTGPAPITYKARSFVTNKAESPVTRAPSVMIVPRVRPSLSASGLAGLFAATSVAAVWALRVRARGSR
jgi:hypothetical protein